jgi:hypothetical protein
MTFQIKTFHPTCKCGRSFQHTQVTSAYVAQKYFEEFGKNPKWEVQRIQHHVRKGIVVELTHYKKIGLRQQNLFVTQKSQFRRSMY